MGLSICQRICQLMGGDIELLSDDEQSGCHFAFHIRAQKSDHIDENSPIFQARKVLIQLNEVNFPGNLVRCSGSNVL